MIIREDKAFTGVLTALKSRAIEENIVLDFTIRHQEEGEVQQFLQSLEDKTIAENISNLFKTPVSWKSISIEAGIGFDVEFDEIEFSATLEKISVSRAYKKDSEVFTYNLHFRKETDLDIDAVLQTYLNQKEEDDNGKRVLIQYSVYMKPHASFSSEENS